LSRRTSYFRKSFGYALSDTGPWIGVLVFVFTIGVPLWVRLKLIPYILAGVCGTLLLVFTVNMLRRFITRRTETRAQIDRDCLLECFNQQYGDLYRESSYTGSIHNVKQQLLKEFEKPSRTYAQLDEMVTEVIRLARLYAAFHRTLTHEDYQGLSEERKMVEDAIAHQHTIVSELFYNDSDKTRERDLIEQVLSDKEVHNVLRQRGTIVTTHN